MHHVAEFFFRLIGNTLKAWGRLLESLVRFVAGRPVTFSLVGALAAPAFLLFLGTPLTIVHVVPLLVMNDKGLISEIRESDARKQGTALYDSAGRFVGAMSGRLDSDPDYNADLVAQVVDGRIIQPDRKSLFVENPPEGYLACLYALEDSHLGDPFLNPHGNDLGGLVRLVTSNVKSVVTGHGLNGAGGSTLANMYIQQLVRPKQGNVVMRKMAEWRYAPVAKEMLDDDGFRKYAQFAARHLPHVMAVKGERGTVYGIELASQVLFGKSASELTLGEQFVLAASVRRPISFGDIHGNNGVDETRDQRWRNVLARAESCIAEPKVYKAVIKTDAGKADVEKDLKRLAGQPPVPRADHRLEELGKDRFSPEVWAEKARDPFRRADIFAYNAVRGLKSQLIDRFGLRWSRHTAQIRLTIDIAADRGFSLPFRQGVRALLARRADINPDYLSWLSYGPGEKEPDERPEIVAAVADSRGRLVHYYSSKEVQTYFGASSPPPKSEAETWVRYDPANEARELASIGKIAAALVLAKEGVDPQKVIPDPCPKEQPDAEARECGKPITVEQAFARSSTGAIEGLLNQVDRDGKKTREVIDELGWSMKSARGTTAAHAAAAGLVAASPRTVHQTASLVLARLEGRRSPVAPPSLIDAARLVDLDAGRLSDWLPGTPMPAEGPAKAPFPFEDKFYAPKAERVLDPRAPAFSGSPAILRTLLSAPVCDAHGTLSALAPLCHRSDIAFIFGKTGTLDVSTSTGREDAILTAWITGGVKFRDGRSYTFVLVAGGDNPQKPLTYRNKGEPGQGFTAGDLSPLVRLIIEDLAHIPDH